MTPAAPSSQRLSQAHLFANLGYVPHPPQQSFHAAARDSRFRLGCFGRRTGKSNMGGHELTQAAFRAYYMQDELSPTGRRHEYWIVGPEYSDGEKEFRVLYDDLTRLGMPMDKPGTYYSVEGGQMDVSLWGGRFQVHVKSAKYPNSLVGEALEGVILAEAAKLKPTIWYKFIRPMLADYRGWATITSTPEGKNWFYDMYRRGQDPADSEVWSLRAPSWSNTILFPQGRTDPEIISMGRDMTEEKFKQEIGADFTEFVGRVYKLWDEEVNVLDLNYNPALPLYVATDWGYTNPNVVLFIQVGPDDTVYVIAEYYKRNRTDVEMAQDIRENPKLSALMRMATALYPDPEDPAAAAHMANEFKLQIRSGTGGLLKNRIDIIRKWLKPYPDWLEDGHPEKRPRILADRSCVELNREMLEYRYPESQNEARRQNDPENPLKKDDHAPEALSRFFGGHFGEQEKPQNRRARQSQARFAA